MRLSDLSALFGIPLAGDDVDVSGATSDSRAVAPGDLFFAVPGDTHDGAAFVAAARTCGAVAVCAEAPHAGIPTLVAPDVRAVMGGIAAAVYGTPCRELAVIGVTGTLGKTTTSLTLAHLLDAGLGPVGVIGSLGIRTPGRAAVDTGMTTPEAPVIQGAMRQMLDGGARHAVMEVSSHSLLLGRVDGVTLAMGIFLNLVPDEHLEFHPTPEHYLETKLRFLDLLAPDAPLVHNGDDPRTREAMARDATARPDAERIGISSHGADDASVWVRVESAGVEGSRLHLEIRRELPTLDGARLTTARLTPTRLTLPFPLLGAHLAWNAVIAAVSALVAGVPADRLAAALSSLPRIHRRMELLHAAGPLVIDDTAGNPRSIRSVLETVRHLPHGRVRIVYVPRGQRGTTINAGNGVAIAELVRALDADLVVSTSVDHANARNAVTEDELAAVQAGVVAAGVSVRLEPELARAVATVVADAADDDLILLLGAQGMDAGARLAQQALAARRPAAADRPAAIATPDHHPAGGSATNGRAGA